MSLTTVLESVSQQDNVHIANSHDQRVHGNTWKQMRIIKGGIERNKYILNKHFHVTAVPRAGRQRPLAEESVLNKIYNCLYLYPCVS